MQEPTIHTNATVLHVAPRPAVPPGLPTPPPLVSHPRPPRLAVIETVVAQVFGIDVRDLRRTTRGRAPVALARQVAMYLAHAGCGLNMSDAGKLFARDRTTVAHACCVIEDRRDDPVFDRTMELLEAAVTALVDRCIAATETQR